MPYDPGFFRKYAKFIKEPTVRRNHDRVFAIFASLMCPELPQVMDLGCGLGEYHLHDPHHTAYVGIDRHNPGGLTDFIEDYTQFDFVARLPFPPNAFISLFSLGICYPPHVKYALCDKIFTKIPSIRYGLVSGFIYERRRKKKRVKEKGGLWSWQTIEDPARHISKTFHELRLHVRTPSRMWGPDVIEVWSFLMRK